jgi:hypothetical protein
VPQRSGDSVIAPLWHWISTFSAKSLAEAFTESFSTMADSASTCDSCAST